MGWVASAGKRKKERESQCFLISGDRLATRRCDTVRLNRNFELSGWQIEVLQRTDHDN